MRHTLTEDSLPLVSCLMPTYNRRNFLPYAILYFLRQEYAHKELIIIDDGSDSVADLIPDHPLIRYKRLPKKITLGAKLNLACAEAKGDLLALWDDDDWYAPRRLTYQVETLRAEQTSLCGISTLLYVDLIRQTALRYRYPPDQPLWISALCFTRALWQGNPFADTNVGMDGLFVWATSRNQITVLPDPTFAVHMIHARNVSPKQTKGSWWSSHSMDEIEAIMNDDLLPYKTGLILTTSSPTIGSSPKIAPIVTNVVTESCFADPGSSQARPLRNVYACLVHEKPDCISDLVRNLRCVDPDSTILLYNGGTDDRLLQNSAQWESMGAVLHPNPRPMKHGYLHQFALDSIAFSADQLPFDTLTIVDSDQLAIRPGYPAMLGTYLAGRSGVGLLSNRPERCSESTHDIWPVTQAFREFDLWKPWLRRFPDGENKFVHWSFWPSTVFVADAARELLQLFRSDTSLHQLMQETKIWATEEIILPTLVRLLGYEIAQNPANSTFVQYQKSFSLSEINRALATPNAYWVHPIARQAANPLRSRIRQQFNHYAVAPELTVSGSQASSELFRPLSVLQEARAIQGWLSDAEAELLMSIGIAVCQNTHEPPTLIEIGSYHGKATLVLGRVIQAFSPQARLVSIDPHNGQLGSMDQGLRPFPPSLLPFRSNLEKAGLAYVVEVIQAHPEAVDWQTPVSLLVIDGLHDYASVARDFWQFANHIQPGGYVAFHDYADYSPGVKAFVHELVATKTYRFQQQADTLVVLQLRKEL